MTVKHLTEKQERFVLAYVETGNASEAYRRSYDVGKMDARTAQKRAQELLHHTGVAARIAELRARAAEKAVLNRSWVLTRLMENAAVSLAEKTIKQRVQHRDKETGEVSVKEVEVTAHDAAAANRALELLGKTDEVRAFVDRVEATGKDGVDLTAPEVSNRDLARAVLDILRTAKLSDEPPKPSTSIIDESEPDEDIEIDELAPRCSSNAGK